MASRSIVYQVSFFGYQAQPKYGGSLQGGGGRDLPDYG
jgi:hypothetical protein